VRQRSEPAHGHTDAPSAAVKRAPQRPCPCPTLPVWAPHHPPEGGPRAGAGRRWSPTPDHPAPETPSACRPPSSTPPDSAGACRCYRWGFHRHPRRSAPGNANAAVPIGDLPCDHMPPRWWGSRSHVLIDCLRRGCGLRNALAPVLVVCLKFTFVALCERSCGVSQFCCSGWCVTRGLRAGAGIDSGPICLQSLFGCACPLSV